MNLSFQINSLHDFNTVASKVIPNYYGLNPHNKTINIQTNDIDKEIELINFYNPSYFYIKNNPNNISIDYNNYYFKIYFDEHSFNGKLMGLDLSNSTIELTNNNTSFKLSESKGLTYKLSKEEKRQKGTNISFYIEGYNSIRNTTLSRLIAEKALYIFNLTIYNNNYSFCLNEILPYYYFNESSMSYYICYNLTKEEIIENISIIMQDIEIGKKYKIKGNDITIYIFPLNYTHLYSLNDLNFSQCENTIRKYYNLSSQDKITFLEIEMDNNSLNNQTLYTAYHNNDHSLDLLRCNSSNMIISKSSKFPSLYSIQPIFPLDNYFPTTYIYTTYIDTTIIYTTYIDTPITYTTHIDTTYIEANNIDTTYMANNSKNRSINILSSFGNKTKEELLKNLSSLIKEITIGESYEIQGDDYNIKIRPTNVSYLSSTTHVNFEKCEKFLRYYYNISESKYITFMQLEVYNTNSKILINKVEYQAYDNNKEPLDLSLCYDKNIKIVHSIKSSSLFDIISATSFKELGIDIFNIKDSFFTDVCHSYSNLKNDMTLKDRIIEIFQNFSLCEEDCSYDEINLVNMTITCDCRVKTNISLDNITENLMKYEEKSTNFQIIKCYNLFFSPKGKSFNIGFWIFLILVTAHIPLLIIYFYKGIKPIKEYIFHEMIEFGYINKKDNKVLDKRHTNKEGISRSSTKVVKKIGKKNSDKVIGEKNEPPKNKNHKIKIKNVVDETTRKDLVDKNNILNLNLNLNLNNQNIIPIKINRNNSYNNINSKIKKSQKTKKGKNISKLPTGENLKKNERKKRNRKISNKSLITEEKSNNIYNFNIININLNDKEKTYVPKESKQILNNYTFKQAIKHDYRSICLIYYIILLSKQAIFHAFLFKSPLELFSLRLCLLIFIYSSDLALNALFYLDDKISEKYHYARSFFLFAFSNNITVILLSTLVGFFFMTLFTNLSNSTNEMRNVFREEEEKLIKDKKYNVSEKRKKEIVKKIEKILKKFKIKMIVLVIIEFSLMLFFWYYVTVFCHVYNSTQYSWLFDSFLSILSRSVFDFLYPLGLEKLYRMAVESNVYCLYKIVVFLYSFA